MPSQDELHYEPDDIMLGVDMRQCQHLARAFDLMAERIGPVTNTTVLWTLASLVAKILAESAMDPGLI